MTVPYMRVRARIVTVHRPRAHPHYKERLQVYLGVPTLGYAILSLTENKKIDTIYSNNV